MGETIRYCRCHLVVAKDRSPLGKLQIRRQDHVPSFVTVGDDPK